MTKTLKYGTIIKLFGSNNPKEPGKFVIGGGKKMTNRDYYYSSNNGELPLVSYNSIIGAVLLWGFALSAIVIKVAGPFFATWNPILLLVVYMIVAIAGGIISHASNKPFVSFIGYNMVVVPFGAVLSVVLQRVNAVSVLHAAAATAGVMLVMVLLSIIFPKVFLSMGRILCVSLLVVVIVEVVCLIAGWYRPTIFDWIVVLIFCGYVGYDWAVAQERPHTLDNAIDSCVDLYMDAANLFIRILSLIDDD